jgi:hypothetical protein
MLFAVPVGFGLLGYATRRHSWLLVLMLLGCAAIGVALFLKDEGWWSLGIPAIMAVIIFAGRYGVLMWLED